MFHDKKASFVPLTTKHAIYFLLSHISTVGFAQEDIVNNAGSLYPLN